MRFIGLDVSSVSTGVAVIDMTAQGELTVIYSSNIITNSKDATGKRLRIFAEEFTGLLAEFKPDVVVKESTVVRMGTQMILAKFDGVFDLVLDLEGYPKPYQYSPTTIKKTVAGHGRATKEAVAEAIQTYTAVDVSDMTNDETDAIAIVLCHIGKTAKLIPKAEIAAAREFDKDQQEAMEGVAQID